MTVDWITPKTDWVSTDRFNITDFNRIRNNMIWLYEKSVEIFGPVYPLDDMGEAYDVNDDDSYRGFWDVNHFNAFESNLDTINERTVIVDYGVRKTFYPNGLFIQWDELNRIESAQLDLREKLALIVPSYKNLAIRLNHPYHPFKIKGAENYRPTRSTLPFSLSQKLDGEKQFK